MKQSKMISFRLPEGSASNIWLVSGDVHRGKGMCRWQSWMRSSWGCVTKLPLHHCPWHRSGWDWYGNSYPTKVLFCPYLHCWNSVNAVHPLLLHLCKKELGIPLPASQVEIRSFSFLHLSKKKKKKHQ